MIYSYNPLHTHPQTEMVGQEPSEHTVSLCWKPENNTRCSTRTITNIEILESHFEPNHQEGFHPSIWASWCILSCQLYTPQCHLLAKNFQVFIALMATLGLGTEESLSQGKIGKQHLPTTTGMSHRSPSVTLEGGGNIVSTSSTTLL